MNKYLRFGFVASLVLLSVTWGQAQTIGDYRSINNGNWSNLTIWQRWNGTAWVTPSAGQGYPGQNSSPSLVLIQAFTNVTLDVTLANNLTGLTLDDFFALLSTAGNRNLTVTGNLNIGFFSFFTFSGNGGKSARGWRMDQ